MKILELYEEEDGSALVNIEMSGDEMSMLVEYALINLIKEAINDGRLQCPERDEHVGQSEFSGF